MIVAGSTRPSQTASKCSIFLGGVPPEANLKDVYEAILHEVGMAQGWHLELKGKSDKCKHLGFGFIHCETDEAIEAFMEIKSFHINGRLVECKEGWSIEEHKLKTDQDRQRKIFVSCIKKNTRKAALVEYFSAFGKVRDVVIGKDKLSGRKLGFCVVEFAMELDTYKVLAVKDHCIQGKQVKCQKMLLKHELHHKTGLDSPNSPQDSPQQMSNVHTASTAGVSPVEDYYEKCNFDNSANSFAQTATKVSKDKSSYHPTRVSEQANSVKFANLKSPKDQLHAQHRFNHNIPSRSRYQSTSYLANANECSMGYQVAYEDEGASVLKDSDNRFGLQQAQMYGQPMRGPVDYKPFGYGLPEYSISNQFHRQPLSLMPHYEHGIHSPGIPYPHYSNYSGNPLQQYCSTPYGMEQAVKHPTSNLKDTVEPHVYDQPTSGPAIRQNFQKNLQGGGPSSQMSEQYLQSRVDGQLFPTTLGSVGPKSTGYGGFKPRLSSIQKPN